MAHIQDYRKGGRGWRVRYRAPDGKERSKSFAKKSDAERFLISVESEKQTGTWRDPKLQKTLFGVWARENFASRLNLRDSTRATDESFLRNHVIPRSRTCR